MESNSISSAHLHVCIRPVRALSTCRWADEIKGNTHPETFTVSFVISPYVEGKYRGIGEGWARALYGGSTGGWESIAVQIFYPDMFNGERAL